MPRVMARNVLVDAGFVVASLSRRSRSVVPAGADNPDTRRLTAEMTENRNGPSAAYRNCMDIPRARSVCSQPKYKIEAHSFGERSEVPVSRK